MRDYLMIGSVPCEEDCAQVGQENYSILARIECTVFIAQIKKEYLSRCNETDLDFRIKANPHDFGTYYEVALYFDDNDEKAMELAYDIENNCPNNWTEESKQLLADMKKARNL